MKTLPTWLGAVSSVGKSVGNVGILAGSAFAGQALIALGLPALSRLYRPEDFGLAAVFASTVGIVTVVASLRYELAIPLPKDDRAASSVLVLAVAIVAGVALTVAAAAAIAGDRVLGWVNLSGLGRFLWLLPVSVVGVGLYQVFSFWAIRKREFRDIARSRLNQALALVTAQGGLGLLGVGPLGLLLGDVLGRMTGLIALARAAWRGGGSRFRNVTRADMWSAARRYRTFPLLSSWAALLNNFGVGLPAFVLASQYGSRVVGWYVLAVRVLAAPMNVVATSVNQVFIADAARALHTEPKRVGRLLRKAMVGLLYVAVPYVVVVTLAGPVAFRFIFGTGWEESGTYARVLALMCLLEAVASATGGVLDVLERQDLHLLREIVRVILLLTAGVCAVLLRATPLLGLAFLSAAGSVAYIVYIAISVHALGSGRSHIALGGAGYWE